MILQGAYFKKNNLATSQMAAYLLIAKVNSANISCHLK